jgi:hypothetical protein
MSRPSATIVVADSDAFGGAGGLHRGRSLEPSGAHALSQGGLFAEPSGVAFLRDGTILVSDAKAFGGNGGLITVVPGTGQQAKAFTSPEFLRPVRHRGRG